MAGWARARASWAADTLRLIDHLGLDRVHLVGHSTGGTIAQVLAADHSDRVASLVLDATWARLDARLCKLFVFRKQALYEQVGFDRRSAPWHTPQEIAAARIDALLTYDAGEHLRNIRKNRTGGFPAYGLYGAFLVKGASRHFCRALLLHSLFDPRRESVPTAYYRRRRAQ